jgi:parvulin-like peptidyl-prolyl isomerase
VNNPRVQDNKGELGWCPLDILPELARAEVKTVKLMRFTHPVQTPSGFQIFRVEGRGNEAQADALEDLRNRFVQSTLPNLFKKLQSDAKIERTPE